MRSEHDSHVVLATIGPLAACLAFFIVWQSDGGGAISLPLLPIPSFTLPVLPNITLPRIHVPVRHLVRTISRNPVPIGTIAEFILSVYRTRRKAVETSPTDA